MSDMRHTLRIRRALAALFLCVLWPTLARAQVVNPTTVCFGASADHNAVLADKRPIVERYDLELAGGATPTVTALGKPTPDTTGNVCATPAVLPALAIGPTYTATILTVGPGGTTRSEASLPFVRLGAPAATGKPVLR